MLTKLPHVDITPAVLPSPARPEMIVCAQTPPDASPRPVERSGYYGTLCIRPIITLPNGVKVESPVPLCTSVWIDSGG